MIPMGELERRRRERDLHLSRSHLGAAAVGLALWTVGWFAGGYLLGASRSAPEEGGAVTADLSARAAPPRDADLLELLARVEASASPDGTGELRARLGTHGLAPEPPALPPPAEVAEVSALTFVIDLGTRDAVEAEAVATLLRDREIDVGVERVEGTDRARLVVGPFPSEQAAAQELAALNDELVPLGVEGRVAAN